MARKPTKTAIKSHRHVRNRRKNTPTEAASVHMDAKARAPKTWRSERSQRRPRSHEPTLNWDRGKPAGGWNPPAHPLYIQEKIHPCHWIESLTKDPGQYDFGHEFNGLPEDAKYKWYEYEGNWSNRLIRGDSSQVMASLIEREGMRGQVQMMYFDPPYGVKFKGTMQVSTGSREVKDREQDLPNDLPTLQAFRDTYDNGLHSYLDTIQRNCELGWELLRESGSIFLQIGNDNMARLLIILDEVFGADNRVAIIPFQKKGSTTSRMIPEVVDYILWYCKDVEIAHQHYHDLYEEETIEDAMKSWASYAMVQLQSGECRDPTAEERKDAKKLPDGARVFGRERLTSQGHSTTGRSEPYIWNGTTYECPPREQWTVSMEGMKKLDENSRLVSAGEGTTLRWKKYKEERPGRLLNNLWAETLSPYKPKYVVETAKKVVERCMLMCTEPGDLVLDPTSGSGTTAAVAENWGRRWIVIDTSAVSVALTRQRVATQTMIYYHLQDSREGALLEAKLGGDPKAEPYNEDTSQGFVYERVPYVSAKVLGYELKPETTLLVNKPMERTGIVRVASPFTVESSSPQRYISMSDRHDDSEAEDTIDQQRQRELRDRVLEALTKNSILTPTTKGQAKGYDVRYIETITPEQNGTSRLVTHIGSCQPSATNGRNPAPNAGIVIAPDDVTVPQEYIRTAIRELEQRDGMEYLIVIGFAFEPSIKAVDAEDHGRITVIRAQANRDLMIDELRTEKGHMAFVVVAEPAIDIIEIDNDTIQVELKGWQTYDPITGNLRPEDTKGVHCWMMDTNYDSHSFMVRDIHFCDANDSQIKRLRGKIKAKLNSEAWDAMISMRSVPFQRPETGLIAVKVITKAGNEMTTVMDA